MDEDFRFGMNTSFWAYWQPNRYSRDLVRTGSLPFDILACQTVLAEAHTSGSGYIDVVNSDALIDGQRYTTPGYNSGSETIAVKNASDSTGFICQYSVIPRTGRVYLRTMSGSYTDVNLEAGSIVEARRGGSPWQSSFGIGLSLMRPEFLAAGGRKTGYPDGLLAGQQISLTYTPKPILDVGFFIPLCQGTGKIRLMSLKMGGPNVTFNFTDGVWTNTGVSFQLTEDHVGSSMTITITESQVGNPIHDMRVIAPDGPEHVGASSISLYQANAANPNYDLLTPEVVNRHKFFSPTRFLQAGGADAGTPFRDWSTVSPHTLRPGWTSAGGFPPAMMIALCNQANSHAWFCMPHNVTDDYVDNLAALIRDTLKDGLHAHIELGNELWNFANPWIHGLRRYAALWAGEVTGGTIISVTGTTATAHRQAPHGLTAGADNVLISMAADNRFNGTFAVLTTPTPSSFTFTVPSGTPAQALPINDWPFVMSYKADEHVKSIPDATINFKNVSGAWTVYLDSIATTIPGWTHNTGDCVLLSGFDDPAANGFYYIAKPTSGAYNGKDVLEICLRTFQPVPAMANGDNYLASKSGGGGIKLRRVIGNNVVAPADAIAPVPAAQGYLMLQSRYFHDRMIAIAGSADAGGKLIRQLCFGVPNSGADVTRMLNLYKGADASLPPFTHAGCAPYFQLTSPLSINGFAGTRRNIDPGSGDGSLSYADGVVTVVTSSNHGWATDDRVQIYHVADPAYCGVFPITVVNATTFTYVPVTTPTVTPAVPAYSVAGTYANQIMRACLASTMSLREAIALSRDGLTLTVTSPGHGFTTSTSVRMVAVDQVGYRRDYTATRIDDNQFTVTLPSDLGDPASIWTATGQRVWFCTTAAYDSIVDSMMTSITVNGQTVVNRQAIPIAAFGAIHNCYEGGQHLDVAAVGDHPGIRGMFNDIQFDQRMRTLLIPTWIDMLKSNNVVNLCYYNLIWPYTGTDYWGAMSKEYDFAMPKWQALLDNQGENPDPAGSESSSSDDGGGPGPDPDPDPESSSVSSSATEPVRRRLVLRTAGGRLRWAFVPSEG